MPEIREVHISKIRPNPFRDIENYPFWRDKLDRLKESMKSTGAWPNIIVRPDPKEAHRWELAFGHHRLKAMEELGLESVFVIVQDLDDDAMLKMMADENAEEFGTNFMLGTMNAVGAVVKAVEKGLVKLDHGDGPMISANSVGRYLGWTTADKTAKGGLQASQKVWTAFNALELIKLGVCKPTAFQGLGHEQARAVVQQAQVIYKARLRELEKEAEEKEVEKAKREATKLAAASVQKSVGAIRDGVGVRDLREETKAIRSEVQAVPTQKKQDPKGVDISRMLERGAGEWEDLATKVELLAERQANLVKTFAAGAICDKQIEKRFASQLTQLEAKVGRFAQAFGKARERRG